MPNVMYNIYLCNNSFGCKRKGMGALHTFPITALPSTVLAVDYGSTLSAVFHLVLISTVLSFILRLTLFY